MDVVRVEYSCSFFILLVLPILCLLIYLHWSYKLNYWKRRNVHQLDTTSKIFGDFKNAILFRTAPGFHLGEIYSQATSDVPFVGFYIFHKPCLLVKDPEVIKHILTSDFNNFSNRHFGGSRLMDSIGMVNLFGLKDPAWRYLRKKITPAFTRSKLKQILPLMMKTAKPMMEYLTKNISTDETKVLDAQEVNNKLTGDIIANIAFGVETDSFNYPHSDYSKFITDFFYSLKRMIALVTVFFIPELVAIIGSSLLFDASFMHEIFWKTLEAREKSKEKRGDFIDTVIQLKNGEQHPLYKFEGLNLFYQSGTFFTGFESSSTATTFTLLELAKNKKYQELAREDIKNAIDTHGWTMNAFGDMKYLDQCIAESLRLHPSISTIDRCTLEDYKIPNTNVIIEKGTPVYISLHGLHSDPKFFDEPKVFYPDRFSSGSVPDAYIPFGAGPRNCIGVKLAQLHIKMVVSMILSEFEVYQKPSVMHTLDPRSTFTAAVDGINLEFSKLI